VRRPARNGPKGVETAPTATVIASRHPRTDYSDLVELARRMSIPDDDAIRGVLDRAMGLPATDGNSEPR
jgi:hypothetical protein